MKKWSAIILVFILTMTGCGNSNSTGNKALDGDLKLESNQSLIIAQVTAIYGNEITLALAKEVDSSESKGNRQDEDSVNSSDTDTNKTEKDSIAESTSTDSTQQEVQKEEDTTQDMTVENGSDSQNSTIDESEEKAFDTQERTSGDNMPSQDGLDSGDSSDMPSGGRDSSDDASKEKDSEKETQSQVTMYTLTGEEMTTTIPVGTPVTTLLGTVTTFSRIAVDNTLKIVTETNDNGEDVIVAIYIVG
ncbi:hypothetical protein C8E03_101661 [Lachnotalea glycerini]|uniref:Uncharacterized protein n=1 Tax=Lachnotalea glycerini TaxID=1763509 RepID=A0A318F2D9_9FIRM|nr:hypothetical protein [Lachnotalea glycerini]PXV96028.1 hypothetical protein C8E03_101661 [Lachnotalea glycerini]